MDQIRIIERMRRLCENDERVTAAMMYGSFARGEGDCFSDVEFVLFFADEHLPRLDRRSWAAQVAPLALFFADDSGHYTAIYDNLVRGEFHFYPASQIAIVSTWKDIDRFLTLDGPLLLDRTGELTLCLEELVGPPLERDTPEIVGFLTNNFINWMLFGGNVLARGEMARALELLNIAQRTLLKLVRLDEGRTAHWLTPSKGLEVDLSPQNYRRFQGCTACLTKEDLRRAYRRTWDWGGDLMQKLNARHGLSFPAGLVERITEAFFQ